MQRSPASLKLLQRRFFSSVKSGTATKPLLSAIRASADFSAEERFDVYAAAYRLRLLEALDDDFPQTAAVLGSAKFERFGRDYIDHHPSESISLTDFGSSFAEFLRSKRAGAAADLAELEWAFVESFYAEESTDSPHALNENIILQLKPAVFLISSAWNLEKLFNKKPQVKKAPSYFVVYRIDDEVKWDQISKPYFEVLTSLRNPHSLISILKRHKASLGTPASTKKFFEWCQSLGLLSFKASHESN